MVEMLTTELSNEHKAAWIGFLVSHSVLIKKIDRALAESGHITLDVYDALLALEDAPERRLRMSELAERVLLSRSGITRLVDRLEQAGYVTRQACPGDRRALWASLTPEGLKAREEAWPVYRRTVQELFGSRVSLEEAEVLRRVFLRLLEDYPSCLLHGMPACDKH